jgi:hypothetical protein
MAPANNFVRDVMARFEDFVGPGIQWQRALWDVGLAMALREVREASDGVRSGALSTRALKRHAESVTRQISKDPGVGDEQQARRVKALLTQDLSAGGVNYHELGYWIEDVHRNLLSRWRSTVGQPDKPSREQVARALASELLRRDLSPAHLRRWMRSLRHLPDLVDEDLLFARAEELVASGTETYEVMLLLAQPPSAKLLRPTEWRDAREISQWLQRNGFARIRQHGGLLFEVQARDPYSAAEFVADRADRLSARASVGTRERLEFLDRLFVGGYPEPLLKRRSRRAEVRALERENTLLTADAFGEVDQALELLSHLNTGPAPVAAAAGWAAVESLLSGPGDEDKVVTADRLANLVACSWPRAELTTIAWARVYQTGDSPDQLATDLASYLTNRERADRILTAIDTGEDLRLEWPAERMAVRRMESLLRSPRSALLAVRDRAGDALRRLYRQRNLVVHGGQTAGFGLTGALRTAAPLVGAGMDRVTHAAIVTGIRPLELAARAQHEIERAGTSDAPLLTSLLE